VIWLRRPGVWLRLAMPVTWREQRHERRGF
jgi:hypothetical protein